MGKVKVFRGWHSAAIKVSAKTPFLQFPVVNQTKNGTAKDIYSDTNKFIPEYFCRDIKITRYGKSVLKFPIPISENEPTELIPKPYIKPKSINPFQTIAEVLNLSSTIPKSQNLTIDEETKQKLHAELVALMRSKS